MEWGSWPASRWYGAPVPERYRDRTAMVTGALDGSLEETLETIQALGGEAHAIVADLSDAGADRGRVITQAEAALSDGIVILVNNAAASFHRPVVPSA